ncbi:hypothetical protein [Brevundimonas sp. PAMC22021]|uniref:hypothetical protein n=1 Tax=Brevundimonas sp. PAMC22021 TaxID=2861285 RepID=UPI001C62C113|nr:hypothetical protein [Brevundimonas sp. PAMC22021]QYF86045.1 hypothetical protein KY493_09265 [Brevundimonas sp. PAMC22021]
MRHAPSRPSALAVAGVLASALIAAPASAQTAPASGEATGLRYLSWPGKALRPAPARVAASSPPAAAFVPPAPSPILDQPMRRAEASPRQGLTPASAFYTPGASITGRFAPEPTPAPPPAPAPQPTPEPEVEPEVEVPPAPQPRMRRVAASPRVVASAAVAEPSGPSGPPPEPTPQPVDAAPAAADPMAPRRDAPIFRLQRQAAPGPTPAGAVASGTAPVPADPSASGARYYSVHRQHGQRPDAIAAPEPAWLDTMPVQLATAPSDSATDLAAPPAPALRRDASGKLQPAAPLVSGDPS